MPKNYYYYANTHNAGILPMGFEKHNEGRAIASDVLNWVDSGNFIRYNRKRYDSSNIMDFLRLFKNWS
jgi:hypothetical protein